MKWEKEIEFLTPMFCRGAYQDAPELRAPSIRSMTRWWFRALGGTRDEEKEVFGGLNRFGERTRGQVIASRLVVRVSTQQTKRAVPDPLTLPHKQGRQGSPQAAFAAGGRFLVQVSSRLGGLSPEMAQKVAKSLDVWVLLGALGLRANRAGGSIWPADSSAPETPAALRQRLNQCDCHWAVSLAPIDLGETAEDLRAAATNTVEGYPEVFGQARGARVASAVKMKVILFGNIYRLLITARERNTLDEAKRILKQARKPLGELEWEIV
jgi:hypothetical protein